MHLYRNGNHGQRIRNIWNMYINMYFLQVETLWTIPVVAFHDRPKYLQDSTFYAIVPVRTVKEFGTLIEKGKIRQIRFNTSYRIF